EFLLKARRRPVRRMRVGDMRVEEEWFVAMAFEPRKDDFVDRRGIGGPVCSIRPLPLDHRKLHNVVEAALESGNLPGPRTGSNVRGHIPGAAELFGQGRRTLRDGVGIVENPVSVGINRSEQRGYGGLGPRGLRLAVVEYNAGGGQLFQERGGFALVS